MKLLIIAIVATSAFATGTLNAFAGTELDRAMGAGSFLHPTGPANGVWHSDHSSGHDKY
jgi:hypothetical protein